MSLMRIGKSGARISTTVLLIALIVAIGGTGCRRQNSNNQVNEAGGFAVNDTSDCLPDITLVDQHGQNVALSSLKGKPVLFDFIYTTCPGPCLVLTSRMKRIANQLGPALGKDVRIISVTVDPEHDHPEQLLTYAKKFDADTDGWLFLTGTPQQIDDLMGHFNLIRQREANGTVDHVVEFFLVGADGRAMLQYMGEKADPKQVASDMEQAAAGRSVTAGVE
jgi:protein SCO1